MFIGHKLQVDLGDLHEEKDLLASFLNTKLKMEFTLVQNKLVVESETLSPQELEHAVNKFIYQKHLNSTHWVSLEGKVVKINKFQNKDKDKDSKKPDKHKKNSGSASNVTQSWGF